MYVLRSTFSVFLVHASHFQDTNQENLENLLGDLYEFLDKVPMISRTETDTKHVNLRNLRTDHTHISGETCINLFSSISFGVCIKMKPV
jgi:hypothetical protein